MMYRLKSGASFRSHEERWMHIGTIHLFGLHLRIKDEGSCFLLHFMQNTYILDGKQAANIGFN